ncbi:MAG: hypothetical protein ACK559_21905, partial [bacterium]
VPPQVTQDGRPKFVPVLPVPCRRSLRLYWVYIWFAPLSAPVRRIMASRRPWQRRGHRCR